MTTEMQEIAITEDKPLLTGQADTVKVRDDVTQTEACTHTYGTLSFMDIQTEYVDVI